MGINEKITYLQETKELIKDAIEEKGVEVADTDSFRSYADKIKSIPQEGGNPYYEDLYNLRTSNGTNMAGLFARMTADSLDLSRLDTSNVTNMSYMFDNCGSYNIDCSGWDVSKVASVHYMFNYCNANVITDGWDTSNWVLLERLFDCFSGRIDISNWDTSNVMNVPYMFYGANLNGIKGISTLKLPKVTSYQYLFESATCDTLDLSKWDISNVTNLERIFYGSKIRRIDLSNWNTSKVTNMTYTFYFAYNAPIEELIIPDWDMTNVTSSNTFLGGTNYTKKLRYIDLSRSNDLTIKKITSFLPTRNATTYSNIVIPENSSQEVIDSLIAKYWRPLGPKLVPTSIQLSFDLDELIIGEPYKINTNLIEPWYSNIDFLEFVSSNEDILIIDGTTLIGKTPGTAEVYARIRETQEVLDTISINVSETDSYPNVLKFKSNGTAAISYVTINDSNIYLDDMEYDSISGAYRYDVGGPINKIRFSGSKITELIKLDVSNLTSLECIFQDCSTLTSLNVSNWDTSNINAMNSAFQGCSALTSLDLSSWDTSKLTNLGGMFLNCSALVSLDLTSWDTSKLTNTSNMFYNCTALVSLDLTSWDTSKVTSMSHMFNNTQAIITVTDSKWTLTEEQTKYNGIFIRV